jgi:hypothetical protein
MAPFVPCKSEAFCFRPAHNAASIIFILYRHIHADRAKVNRFGHLHVAIRGLLRCAEWRQSCRRSQAKRLCLRDFCDSVAHVIALIMATHEVKFIASKSRWSHDALARFA